MKACFLILSAILSSSAGASHLWARQVNKIYLESKTLKDFAKSLPMGAENKKQMMNQVELTNGSGQVLPLMNMTMALDQATFEFPGGPMQIQFGDRKLWLNEKQIKINSNTSYKDLYAQIEKILKSQDQVYFLPYLMPQADAIVGDILFVGVAAALVWGVNYQMTCDKDRDRMCFYGLPKKEPGLQKDPSLSLAENFWQGHLPTVFQCDKQNNPQKIVAEFPIPIKVATGGPAIYTGSEPRKIDFTYSSGSLRKVTISDPTCTYQVDADGYVLPQGKAHQPCYLERKIKANEFLAYAGLWLKDAEDCCKNNCKDEIQKMIQKKGISTSPAAAGVGA